MNAKWLSRYPELLDEEMLFDYVTLTSCLLCFSNSRPFLQSCGPCISAERQVLHHFEVPLPCGSNPEAQEMPHAPARELQQSRQTPADLQ